MWQGYIYSSLPVSSPFSFSKLFLGHSAITRLPTGYGDFCEARFFISLAKLVGMNNNIQHEGPKTAPTD